MPYLALPCFPSLSRSQIQNLHTKISELEGELTEHQLVTEAMKEMEASRRCFRMIGGVLVERTVGEVKPAVERNLHGEWWCFCET